MKKFLKLIWTTEHPFGEFWGTAFISIFLVLTGLIKFHTFIEIIIAGLFFIGLFICVFLLFYAWKHKTSIFWYFYTILLYVLSISSIFPVIDLYAEGVNIHLSSFLLFTSIINITFATMILLGKEFFSHFAWKIAFFVEIALIFVEVYDYRRVEMLRNGIFEISISSIIVAVVLYTLVMLPFFVRLYRHAFGK